MQAIIMEIRLTIELTTMSIEFRFGYQGQFSERDLETGWNHFELTEYDPVIAGGCRKIRWPILFTLCGNG